MADPAANIGFSPDNTRMVMCRKLGRLLPGLDKAPFKGKLGERIFNDISREAWEMWPSYQTLLINHYGLSLGDPNAQDFLLQQMEQFFFSAEGQMPEGWTTPGGGQKPKGGADRK